MKILDVCCGSRMFYYDKESSLVTYMDAREGKYKLSDGRQIKVNPDIVADFRNIPFSDNSYDMVVFDPPHLVRIGYNSDMAKKYGYLNRDTWREDLIRGFDECFKVLKSNGTLIFKWCERDIKISEILKLTPYKPLFGNKYGRTHWLVFIKEEIR